MELLDREADLAALGDALAEADRGAGSIVLIGGEAGIGKTRLVRAFAADPGDDTRILWGACDDLSTPRTLGPFHDIGVEVGGALHEAVSQGGKAEVFDAVLEVLSTNPGPTVVIIEDVHWADGATLDVLKFLGRRIGRLGALLLLTFRHEEVPADHPLMLVIGDLPADNVRRIELKPLSEAAVGRLARDYAGSPAQLFTQTRGNPFLVTEALLAPAGKVPVNVRDAVRARAARLSVAGRSLAEYTSVIPGQVEQWLVDALPEFKPDALEECRRRGLLAYDRHSAWYRHELVRGAMESSLTAQQRRAFNMIAYRTLAERDGDLARIVHHARQAGDAEAVARYAPEAGRRASKATAHREARAHFRAALVEGANPGPEGEADLFSAYAIECYYTNAAVEGLDAAARALTLWRQLGNTRREGDTLRWLSRLHWWLGHGPQAVETGRAAVEVLRQMADTPELAMAYSNLAQVFMLAQRSAEAEEWAERAIAVARTVDDRGTLAHALNNLGSTKLRVGDGEGWALLEESLAISRDEGFDDHAGRAYANLAWTALDYREYDKAEQLIVDGLEYADRRELTGSLSYITAERARLYLDRGEWAAAEADARWVVARPEEAGITNMPAQATLARLLVRRGDPGAEAALETAWHLVEPTGELQRIAPIATARAEFAWLNDRIEAIAPAVADAYGVATAAGQPWITDELAFWMWRGGAAVDPPDGSDTPFAAQMTGRWREAADRWGELGCPYEQALAQADSEEAPVMLEALATFDVLGALPAAARVRRRLRERGVPHVPRGPRPATREHPAGLTGRQVEVLQQLAAGLSNAEIARALYISPKTVDHHVSAVLSKLEVGTRRDAVLVAREQGLI